jgi:hypothetical protein
MITFEIYLDCNTTMWQGNCFLSSNDLHNYDLISTGLLLFGWLQNKLRVCRKYVTTSDQGVIPSRNSWSLKVPENELSVKWQIFINNNGGYT